MEKTPFDPFESQDPPLPPNTFSPNTPLPPDTFARQTQFNAGGAGNFGLTGAPRTNNPVPTAPKRGRSPALWAIPLALLLLVGGGVGWMWWNQKQQIAAREAKLATLRADIKKIVLQDNALVMELLDEGALEHITYAEFFKRAEKNKEARGELVRALRATETGPYGEAVGHYVELLETENKWVRAEEAVSNASLDASTKWDSYQRALKQSDEVSGQVQASYQAYLAAPYGSDFSQKMDYEVARSGLKNAGEGARASFASWSQSQSEWNEKKRAASVVIADWLRDEPAKYLKFAPKRDAARLLIARKTDYASAPASGEMNTVKSATKTVTLGAPDATVEPEAPAVPTRVRATKPLDGERFPATRMEDVGEEFAANLSADDLRYAINEMYARYGMTFKDKSLQSEFEATTWYQPNEKWTMPQINRAFSRRERDNLEALIQERNARRQQNQEESSAQESDTQESTEESGTDESQGEQRTVESVE